MSEVHQRTKLRECGRTGLTLLPISFIGRLNGLSLLATLPTWHFVLSEGPKDSLGESFGQTCPPVPNVLTTLLRHWCGTPFLLRSKCSFLRRVSWDLALAIALGSPWFCVTIACGLESFRDAGDLRRRIFLEMRPKDSFGEGSAGLLFTVSVVCQPSCESFTDPRGKSM